jgi:hypothetical protein
VIKALAQIPTVDDTEMQQIEKDRIVRGYKRLVKDVDTILDQYSEIVGEVIPATRD